jgi:hypothetical protein
MEDAIMAEEETIDPKLHTTVTLTLTYAEAAALAACAEVGVDGAVDAGGLTQVEADRAFAALKRLQALIEPSAVPTVGPLGRLDGLEDYCPDTCTNVAAGTCPECFKNTGIGCGHGPICDECKAHSGATCEDVECHGECGTHENPLREE